MLETTFSPLSFGKKIHKNPFSRSRERLSGIFVTDGEKQQKTEKNREKNICKTYTHPTHRRLRK